MREKNSNGRIRRWALWIAVAVGALVMFIPFAWTVITSISSGAGLGDSLSLIPENPSLDAYRALFSQLPFGRVVINSLVIAVVTTVVQLITRTMAANAFSRLPLKGRNVVFSLYLATMMIPVQVLLVPLFVLMRDMNLIDTYWGVLLPSFASAFGVFLLRQAMNAIPHELDEAAIIDGAGHFRIFSRILLPLLGPSVATFAVFSFMGSWNSFLWPLVILRSSEMKTLPLALASLQGQYTTQWDLMMAGSVVSILPMLAIYIFAQKYVVQGIAGTGLK